MLHNVLHFHLVTYLELLYIVEAFQFKKKEQCCILMSWLVEIVCEMKFLNFRERDGLFDFLEHQFSLPCPDILQLHILDLPLECTSPYFNHFFFAQSQTW